MPTHFSHQYPDLVLHKDVLPDTGRIAAQASMHLAVSARILQCVLRLAAIAMLETPKVTETIRSLQRSLDESAATSGPLSSESIDPGLEFLRVVARQSGQTSLDMYKLIGEADEVCPGRQWINQGSGDSICKIQRRLRDTLEPWLQTYPSRKGKLSEQVRQDRLAAMLDVAVQHIAIAHAALHSVERFNLAVTKIIRAIERRRPCEAGNNPGVGRKLR